MTKISQREIFKQNWIVGISGSINHKCHVQMVEKRTREVLEDIVVSHFKPSIEVTIVSDGWAAYSKREELGYKHKIVTHEREFVNDEGFSTNSVESV